jgi:hypothetical protein
MTPNRMAIGRMRQYYSQQNNSSLNDIQQHENVIEQNKHSAKEHIRMAINRVILNSMTFSKRTPSRMTFSRLTKWHSAE